MDDDLSRAVTLYVGYGSVPAPLSDAERLVPVFGQPQRDELLRAARALVAETAAIEVDWSAYSLVEGGEHVKGVLRRRHPELGDEAIKALAWKWMYDWR
jgi:hypothetical protein